MDSQAAAAATRLLNISPEQIDPSLGGGPHAEKVALLIKLIGRSGGHSFDTPGGHIDIAPTILHYLGITPPASFLGAVLGADGSPLVTIRNGTAISREFGTPLGARSDFCADTFRPDRGKVTRCSTLLIQAKREWEISNLVNLYDLVPLIMPPQDP